MSEGPVKVFKIPESIKEANPLGLRILCIDNGGIRSFSAPYMLEQIMLQAKHILKVPADEDIRPCDVFDLICGTSTGGWIALMLGRLGMTVRQCIKAYEEIRQNVFLNNASSSSDEYAYSAEKLEETLITIIQRHTDSSHNVATSLPMKDAFLQDGCRTFVVSTYGSNVVVPTAMRTYDIRGAGSSPFIPASAYTIWEAARATAAAPLFFPPINMDSTDYVSLGRDNPTAIAVEEAKRIWGLSSEIACLVSLGSGIVPAVNLGPTRDDVARALNAIGADCSRVSDEMKMKMHQHQMGHCYHRFSVDTIGYFKWQEWERKNDAVGCTKAYMEAMSYEVVTAAQSLVKACNDRIAVYKKIQLPPPGACYGREEEVQTALDVILKDKKHLAIIGGAGNGKSTVALEVLHADEIRTEFRTMTDGKEEDFRFWARCDVFSQFSSLSAHLCKEVFGLVPQPGEDELAAVARYFRAHKCLLVLDNFETPSRSDVNKLQPFLQSVLSKNRLSGSILIVTHRGHQVERVNTTGLRFQELMIGRMRFDAGMDLFKYTYTAGKGDHPDRELLVKTILTKLDHHALSIKLFILRANAESTKPLAVLVQGWEVMKTSLLWNEDSDETRTLAASISFSLDSPLLRKHEDLSAFILALLSWTPDGLLAADIVTIADNSCRHQSGQSSMLVTSILAVGLAEDVPDALTNSTRLRMLAPIREHINRLVLRRNSPLNPTFYHFSH